MEQKYIIPLIAAIVIAGACIVLTGNGGLPSTVGPEDSMFVLTDQWDHHQQWEVKRIIWKDLNKDILIEQGWEPFHVNAFEILLRRRIK